MCEICKRIPQFGHNVSHSNRKTNRKWKLNLFKIRGIYQGLLRKYKVCSRCIRSGKLKKPALG